MKKLFYSASGQTKYFQVASTRKALSLVLVILLVITIGGCKKSPQDIPAQATEKIGDITDPVELEKLWQEYLYDSIATIGNTREFHSAEGIDPLGIARFAWEKYMAEYDEESLEFASKDSTLRLFPLDKALEYAQQYFNLSGLDVSAVEEHSYDPKRQAFTLGIRPERNRPTYDSGSEWGEKLAKATRNGDGTVTAVIVRYDSPKRDRIELTKTYTLKEREDGSLYFVSGRWEYVNNHLVSLTGEYQYFEGINGFQGNMGELFMLGEIDGKLILANTPYSKGAKASLLLLNPETMKVEKSLELTDKVELTDLRFQTEKILVCLQDKIIIVDKALAETKDLPLPQAIKATIAREPKYDQRGVPDIFFGGYDVSNDLQKIVYADEIGVKLYNLADNSEKLLAPSKPPVKGERLVKNYPHDSPRFVADDHKVITTLLAYEGTMGYTMCDLDSGEVKKYDLSSQDSSSGFIRYDTGLLAVNKYIRESEEYKTFYLDFRSEDVKEIKLQDRGDTDFRRSNELDYVGQNYAAFLNQRWNSNDNALSMFYLNRLNLETLQVDTNIITVKAAQTHILGVLADGRILFWYEFNPSEKGVGITKK